MDSGIASIISVMFVAWLTKTTHGVAELKNFASAKRER
jgi:hypothetical protein